MVSHPTRRRLLQLSGVGATASLAGCSQFDVTGTQDEGDDDSEQPADSSSELEADAEPDIDPEAGITAIVQPDQEAFDELQEEIMAELEAGEIDQQEAQLELQQRQAELIVDRAVEFESSVADDDDLSIEAGIAEQGAFLLDGSDERLLDTIRNGEVSGLIPGEEYGALLEQQQHQEPPVSDSDGDDEDNESSGDDAESDSGSDSESDGNETNETES